MIVPRLAELLPQAGFIGHFWVNTRIWSEVTGPLWVVLWEIRRRLKRQVGAVCIKAPCETLPWTGTAPLDCL